MITSYSNNDSEYPARIMQLVRETKKDDFSGIGVIFYVSLDFLDLTDLGRSDVASNNLPIVGTHEIASELVRSSRMSSPWHDGFHCVNVRTKKLTHMSQFVSPPLDIAKRTSVELRPTGARQMSALLVSYLKGISGVGLLDSTNSIKFYINGRMECLV